MNPVVPRMCGISQQRRGGFVLIERRIPDLDIRKSVSCRRDVRSKEKVKKLLEAALASPDSEN